MSEQTPQPESTEPASIEQGASPGQPRRARKIGQPNAALSALSRIGITQIALAVLAAIFLWQWQAARRAIDDLQLAKNIAETDGDSRGSQILLAQTLEQLRELSAKVAALEVRNAETPNQRAALEALYADMASSRDESALAEAEQLLLFAAQQLQLSANAKVAIVAMQSADARLQRMNRPAFNGLRKAINQDIGKLLALPSVDIADFAKQLDALMASVDELPLASRQRVAAQMAPPAASPKDETYWQKLVREIGEEAKQLVRIENTGMSVIPLLPPNQEFFLRENLKLRLMSARLALMSRDEESFRRELKTAQLWTARYFEAKSNENIRMQTGLKKLISSSIRIEVPDVSPSLQAVRNFRLTREHEPRANFDSRPKAPR